MKSWAQRFATRRWIRCPSLRCWATTREPIRQGSGGTGKEGIEERMINRLIRVPDIRVIAEDGEQLGIMPTLLALKRAEALDLDLVEIQPRAKPPVCKIMDYGKYTYEQS